MPLLSVITAAHPGRAGLLAAAGDSVAAADRPPGWDVEWIVARDDAPAGLGGIATTRNLALARARGELVHVLDSDDLLLPAALTVPVESFRAHPGIHWAAAQADDLLPDGSRVPYTLEVPPGPVEPGALTGFFGTHGRFPIHCAGLTMRTATVRALGGWVANPRSEDVALLVALAELTPGWITSEVTWLHRKHPGQTTRQSTWNTLGAESLTMIHQRVTALRRVGLRVGG